MIVSQALIKGVVDTQIRSLAMSLIAPFYVAGGFALYLNRRSELEGWDIEICLRRLLARWQGKDELVGILTESVHEAAEAYPEG